MKLEDKIIRVFCVNLYDNEWQGQEIDFNIKKLRRKLRRMINSHKEAKR